MAYTHLSELSDVPPDRVSIDGKLEYCTPAEDSEPASFYPEDIYRITNQPTCVSTSKKMATFWGLRLQVWVGHDNAGNVLPGVVALRCPPYYPPHTYPGVEETAGSKPSGFPTTFP